MNSIKDFFKYNFIQPHSTESLEYHRQNDNIYICKDLHYWFSINITFEEYSEKYKILNKWGKCYFNKYQIRKDYHRWLYSNPTGEWKRKNIKKLPEELQVLVKTETDQYCKYPDPWKYYDPIHGMTLSEETFLEMTNKNNIIKPLVK
jgi:hypothetical protein